VPKRFLSGNLKRKRDNLSDGGENAIKKMERENCFPVYVRKFCSYFFFRRARRLVKGTWEKLHHDYQSVSSDLNHSSYHEVAAP
jgi:hypothetical protein